MRLIGLIIVLLSSFSQAEELKLTTEEFLTKLEHHQVTMQRNPMFALPAQLNEQVMDHMKGLYPNFRAAYWFVPSLKTNRYVYSLFWAWDIHRCEFRVEGWDQTNNTYRKDEVQAEPTVVDKKYCEYAYDTKIND